MMALQNMQLERILGFTTNGRNSFVTQPNTDNLIYIAGCVVVIFDSKTKSQKHLFTSSKQNITTLAISEDGRYLASSDCGIKAKIYIWDLKNFNILNEFIGHNNEVSCMSFSTDNKFLVSVGCQQDMTLCIWEWQKESKIAVHKVQTKIRAISFSLDSSYFVTVGEDYIKYWYIQILTNNKGTSSSCNNSTSQDSSCDSTADLNSSSNLTTVSSSISITNKSAILGEQKKNSFCDVKCGRGRMANSTFCITKSGLLCELNNKRLLHKWVDLKTLNANCLAIGDNIIVIGCANGVTRCFNTTELRFLKNLPRPHSLGVVDNNNKRQTTSLKYPNVICVGLNEETNTISCFHNDRSIYIWNLSNPDEVIKDYSVLYHSSCIWGIDMYPVCATNSILPFGSFITCSSDDTLRIWDPNVVFNNQKKTTSGLIRNNKDQIKSLLNVSESLRIIFTDLTYKYLCDLECSEDKIDQNYDSNEGLRCLKVSPNGKQVAVGSRSGTIRIYNFDKDIEMKSIAAHDAEILCLEYSDPENFDNYCYLASSSRDKLIHIFDALNDYNFLQTIDDHSSSITAIRFVNNRAKDTLQLISCSADQKIIFRNGSKTLNGNHLTFMAEQIIEGKTTFYDMEVDTDSSCLMTACQDRIIRLFNVAQVKYQSGFKGSCSDEGTIIKIALDPSCTFLAASSTDKSISIYDYQRGECIASVSYGLSDLVTDLKFSCDGKHLIACSGDGCIFIWSSPAEIANAIGGNLAIVQLQQPQSNHNSSNSALRLNNQQERGDQQQIDCEIFSNEIDELDGQIDDSMSRNNDNNNKYLVQSATDNNEYIDRVRPIDHQSRNDSSIYNSRDENQMFLNNNNNNMAKFYQSRDNLDRISSREKFVNESLIYKNNEERRLKLRGNSSLSGMFNKNISRNSNNNFEIGNSNTKSLSRYNSQSQSSHALNSALDDEYGSLDDHDNIASNFQGEVDSRDHLISPKPSHIYKQNRRSSLVRGNDIMLTDHHSNRVNDYGRAKSATRFRQDITPIRSSKSECNLGEKYAYGYNGDEEEEEEEEEENIDDQQQNIIPLNNFSSVIHGSNYCKKLDLSKCNPASVLITTELCQYVVDELQTLSKYATRLHQRLQKNSETALCNLVARGVQNSMDILSIVPPRVSQHHQFQSQINLSPATMLSRRRMQSPQQQQQQQQQITKKFTNLSLTSKSRDVGSRKAQIEDQDNNENLEHHEQQQVQTSLPRSKSNLKNIDQVLEAYSDRLFKMVQEKISEQSLGRLERVSGNEVRSEAEKQLPSMRQSFDPTSNANSDSPPNSSPFQASGSPLRTMK